MCGKLAYHSELTMFTPDLLLNEEKLNYFNYHNNDLSFIKGLTYQWDRVDFNSSLFHILSVPIVTSG